MAYPGVGTGHEADAQFHHPGVYSQPITLEPRWTDFYFDGRLLFDELRTYLQEVSVVTEAARRIALAGHGTDNLTYPPI